MWCYKADTAPHLRKVFPEHKRQKGRKERDRELENIRMVTAV